MYRRVKLLLGLFLVESSILRKTGYIRAFASREVCDDAGESIPWMSYSFIAFIAPRLHRDLDLAEFGSGASTRFFAEKVRSTLSIESSAVWYDKVKVMLSDLENADIKLCSLENGYTSALQNLNPRKSFHLVIVDGRKRVECMINAFDALTDNGVLIIDDSGRDRYQEGIQYYTDRGFSALTFSGLAPLDITIHSTTVLYKPANNCLAI